VSPPFSREDRALDIAIVPAHSFAVDRDGRSRFFASATSSSIPGGSASPGPPQTRRLSLLCPRSCSRGAVHPLHVRAQEQRVGAFAFTQARSSRARTGLGSSQSCCCPCPCGQGKEKQKLREEKKKQGCPCQPPRQCSSILSRAPPSRSGASVRPLAAHSSSPVVAPRRPGKLTVLRAAVLRPARLLWLLLAHRRALCQYRAPCIGAQVVCCARPSLQSRAESPSGWRRRLPGPLSCSCAPSGRLPAPLIVVVVKQHMSWDGLNGGRTRCWRIRVRGAS
jgi:hypothetical protein